MLAISLNASATHNKAGIITYRYLFGNTYEFTVKTCTETSSDADRPELEIKWGDGQSDTIQRTNFVDNTIYGVRENTYISTHAFTGPGTFTISVEDPNRNAGIINITNSVNQIFCVQTQLIISPFIGSGNNSVVIENCPCPEFACLLKTYCLNLSAYDPDGDSLSYSLVACKGEDCLDMNIPNIYRFPDVAGGGAMTIDPVSGTLCWENPGILGEYNVAIKISEYRNGIYIGSVLQDLQLTVKDCVNDSPIITEIPDTCVFAGDEVEIIFEATDPGDVIQIFATGALFNFDINPATFTGNTNLNQVSAPFNWTPNCDQASDLSYQFIIHAEDQNPEIQLSDLFTYNIKVNIPPVQDLQVNPIGGDMLLNWDPLNISCDNVSYNIYRNIDSVDTNNECCDPGLPQALGYELIGNVTNTTYLDNDNLNVGFKYCYIITAVNGTGVESCISEQICNNLRFEVPVLTNVSVFETNETTGKDSIYWSWPKELNTGNFPDPYYYELYRNDGFTFDAQALIYTSNTNADITLVDTFYYDQNINTLTQPYTYNVLLYSGQLLVGASATASSIFLTSTPNDNQLELSWEENVPWFNTYYRIYRETPTGSGNFIFIDSTKNQFYVDTNLINLESYCYKVESIGEYTINGTRNPIKNWSQEHCNEPYDFTSPCPPMASISGNCDTEETTVFWTNPNQFCADDVVRYNLYFAPFTGDSLTLLTTIDNALDTFYVHKDRGSISGCYFVTAIDSLPYQNESIPSNTVCIDNCDPIYELPNVFTPNGNDINDLYHPILPYKFVESININIFNRYGDLIFNTTDPMINWDGTYLSTGEKVTDGVYFYNCTINIIKLDGIQPYSVQGAITVINSK